MIDAQEWKPIAEAPFQKEIWVQNDMMDQPMLATRGHMTEVGMHPDNTYCTTVRGQLVIPTVFKLVGE